MRGFERVVLHCMYLHKRKLNTGLFFEDHYSHFCLFLTVATFKTGGIVLLLSTFMSSLYIKGIKSLSYLLQLIIFL